MEKDDELKGSGNSYDFGARILDPRIGRWLSLDPLQAKYPSHSPYNFVKNNPVYFIDPDGRDVKGYVTLVNNQGKVVGILKVDSDRSVKRDVIGRDYLSAHNRFTTNTRAVDIGFEMTYNVETGKIENYNENITKIYSWADTYLPSNIDLEGSGSEQGGFHFVSDEGGSNTTKNRSSEDEMKINIGGFLDALGASKNINGDLAGLVNVGPDLINAVTGIVNEVQDMIKEKSANQPQESGEKRSNSHINTYDPTTGSYGGVMAPTKGDSVRARKGREHEVWTEDKK